MPSLQTFAAIQAHLAEAPAEAHARFQRLFAEASTEHDLPGVERLIRAAEALPPGNPYLEQWLTHARGYLALEARQAVSEAAACQESLRARNDRLAPGLLGRVLNELGIIYEMDERWDRALKCYQECLELYESQHNDLGIGRVLSNLSIIHFKGRDFAACIECATRSVELLSKRPGDRQQQLTLGGAWNELGLAQFALGHLADAQAAFEKCLEIWEAWEHLYGVGVAYNNLADIYQSLGDAAKAEAYYARGRDTFRKVGDGRQEAAALSGLGLLKLQSQAEPGEVQAVLDEALSLASATHNHEIITQIYLRRATLQERRGNLPAALEETRRAVETVESLRANILLPEDRARMTASRIEAYEEIVARLCQQGTAAAQAEAFHFAEMSKSRVLIEMLAGRPLRRPERVPAAWLDRAAELRAALHAGYRQDSVDRSKIEALEKELNELGERIRRRDAEYESFHTVAPLTLEQAMARLPAGAVLLEYFTADNTIWAFVVTSTGLAVRPLSIGKAQLERCFLRDGAGRLGSILHLTREADGRLHAPWLLKELYQALLDPLGNSLRSARLLCIVPHGLLHYVPFHALYQGPDSNPDYLTGAEAEPLSILYAPSATVLLDYCQHKPVSSHAGCLAMGYNDSRLTQAEAEAQAVAAVVGGKCLTGTAANRAAVLAESANYRYLHLSCHGAFNPIWPMLSHLRLADQALDVADIVENLRLNAELVSLSACATGRSQILRGDELIGLTRAFLYAGTPSVLVSHWAVDELSTRLLMEHFYRELAKPATTKTEALGRAQRFVQTLSYDELRQAAVESGAPAAEVEQHLHYLAHSAGYASLRELRGDERLLSHPYYWAPFFLVGDRLESADG